MSVILRPYQNTMIGEARVGLRDHSGVLIQAATGAGKTAIGAHLVGNCVRKEKSALFIVHRQELIEQTIGAFEKDDIPHGVVAAGFHPDYHQPVQICSIDTLKRRLDRVRRPDLVIFDEAHHMAAAGWSYVYNHWQLAKKVGLSATPQRLDGKGLGKYFGKMVNGPPISWLIEQGYLVDYRAYAPTAPDMSNVHTKMGEFVQAEVEEAMNKSCITGDLVEHYLQYARGKRFILFAPSRKYSENIAAAFRVNGVMAIHVDGETDRQDRKRAMQGFRDANIDGLTNVGLFGEGVDVPAAATLIDAAPSRSLTAVMQRWGRVLRPEYAPSFDLSTQFGRLAAIAASNKPYAIILDHAGNMMRHGLPCDSREWSLADRQKKKKSDEESDIAVRQCPECFHLHKPAPQCPMCGYEYEINHRVIEEVAGNLQEINKTEMKAQVKAERGKQLKKAKTLEELVTLAISWGYQYPMEWAERILEERRQWKTQFNKSGYSSYQRNF